MLGITGSSPVARPLTRLSIPERLEQAGRRRVVRERAKGQPWACLRHGADAGIPARRGRPSRPAADQNADAFSQGVRPDGPLLAQCLADVCASLSLFPNLSLLPLNLVNHELDVVKLGHSALLRRRPLLNNRCDRLARVNEPRETADVRVAVLFSPSVGGPHGAASSLSADPRLPSGRVRRRARPRHYRCVLPPRTAGAARE
jgi:hypothetical protein